MIASGMIDSRECWQTKYLLDYAVVIKRRENAVYRRWRDLDISRNRADHPATSYSLGVLWIFFIDLKILILFRIKFYLTINCRSCCLFRTPSSTFFYKKNIFFLRETWNLDLHFLYSLKQSLPICLSKCLLKFV